MPTEYFEIYLRSIWMDKYFMFDVSVILLTYIYTRWFKNNL